MTRNIIEQLRSQENLSEDFSKFKKMEQWLEFLKRLAPEQKTRESVYYIKLLELDGSWDWVLLAFSPEPKVFRQLAKQKMIEFFTDVKVLRDLVYTAIVKAKINGQEVTDREFLWLLQGLVRVWNLRDLWYFRNDLRLLSGNRKGLSLVYYESLKNITREQIEHCYDLPVLLNYFVNVFQSRILFDRIMSLMIERKETFAAENIFYSEVVEKNRYFKKRISKFLLKNKKWEETRTQELICFKKRAVQLKLFVLEQKIISVLAERADILSQCFLANDFFVSEEQREKSAKLLDDLSLDKEALSKFLDIVIRDKYKEAIPCDDFLKKAFVSQLKAVKTYQDWRDLFNFGEEIVKENSQVVIETLQQIADEPKNVFWLLQFNDAGVFSKEDRDSCGFVKAVYQRAFAVADSLNICGQLWRRCCAEIKRFDREGNIFYRNMENDRVIRKLVFAKILQLAKSVDDLNETFPTVEMLNEEEKELLLKCVEKFA